MGLNFFDLVNLEHQRIRKQRAHRLNISSEAITQNADQDNEQPSSESESRESSDQPTPTLASSVGLSLSGGGIRSAAFALGVMQGLDATQLYRRSSAGFQPAGKMRFFQFIDYLSTVSGGGYIGTSLTWFLFQSKKKTEVGKIAKFFNWVLSPFDVRMSEDDQRPAQGKNSSGIQEQSFPFNPEKKAGRARVNFMRQHGNYLIPGYGLGMASVLMALFRCMLVPLVIYTSFFVIIFSLLVKYKLLGTSVSTPFSVEMASSLVEFPISINWLVLTSGLTLVAAIILAFFYSLASYFLPAIARSRQYQFRIGFQNMLGKMGIVITSFFVIGTLPDVYSWLAKYNYDELASLLGILSGSSAGILKFFQAQTPDQKKRSKTSPYLVIAAVLLLIYGVLLLAYRISLDYFAFNDLGLLVLILFTVITGVFVNLNYSGIARMYRDRLAETFMPDEESVANNHWSPAVKADKLKLHKVNLADETGPYHLINTNLILTNSSKARFKGRGGDNFILSSIACGSSATQWQATKDFANGSMTLATAMAISGAAANPNSGVSGQGLTRNKLVSFLMTFLGIRLGYFVSNTYLDWKLLLKHWLKFSMKLLPIISSRLLKPNYLFPGIKQGLLSQDHKEDAAFLELSDGGHFENLALYELVKRRLDLIIVSDAGADPDFSFQDLAHAIERIRVDQNVDIRFMEPFDLVGLMPGTAKSKVALYVERYQLAERGFAIAKINYPDKAQHGWLFYIKTCMTKDLPADLYGYKDAHSKFPDQTTADQFFDEVQFECYRKLGQSITLSMMQEEKVKEIIQQVLKSWVFEDKQEANK